RESHNPFTRPAGFSQLARPWPGYPCTHPAPCGEFRIGEHRGSRSWRPSMKPSTDAHSRTLSNSSREIIERFTQSWDQALHGGPRPAVETFLDALTAVERAGLQPVLELIDKDYLQRERSAGTGTDQQTIDMPDRPSSTGRTDTEPDLDLTVDI